MKDGIRVLGVDDAAFNYSDTKSFITGVVYRGTEFIEDIKQEEVTVDGEDATEALISLFNNCNNTRQIKGILTNGISFAGFNLIDIKKVSEETGKPVIAVTSNEPDKESFGEALEKSENHSEIFDRLDDHEVIDMSEGKCFIQRSGCNLEDAENLIKISTIHGLVPEPIRVAHLIGRAFGKTG